MARMSLSNGQGASVFGPKETNNVSVSKVLVWRITRRYITLAVTIENGGIMGNMVEILFFYCFD